MIWNIPLDRYQRHEGPPPDPRAIRRQGYRYTIASLRNHLRYADMLRMDHVMSLHRLYWIPAGFDATDGVYVRYRPDEFYAIVCLESHRHAARIVGEDLGTVPRRVRRALRRRGVYRTHVLQFDVSADRDPPLSPPPRRSVAGLNTHDMPTFAAFWRGLDIDDRHERGRLGDDAAARQHRWRERIREALARFLQREGRLDPQRASRLGPHGRLGPHREGGLDPDAATADGVLRACLAWLAAGPARALVVNLEDLWLEPRPQNTPGTGPERPNWRRRTRYPFERFRGLSAVKETLAMIDRLRRREDNHDGR